MKRPSSKINSTSRISNTNNNKPSPFPRQKSKVLNPIALKKQYSRQFISNPENFKWIPNEKIPALYNRYGFLGVLNGGFNSTGTNNLEIFLPENFDLSVNQENGFTLFFWFLAQKQPNNVTRYIFKKGNSIDEVTPSIGILPNNSNLFAKIISSRQKIETMISNKKIETNRIYSICLTASYEPNEDLTDVSLFIDGILDSQILVSGSPLHNQGTIFLGKPDSTTHGFVGTICDVIIAPRLMSPDEISQINETCLNCLVTSNGETFNTPIVFEDRFERDVLMEKYLRYTKTSPYIVENLQLTNHELKEIVKKYDKEERDNDPPVEVIEEDPNKTRMFSKMEEMFENEEDLLIVKKLYLNAKFIYTVLSLANRNQDVIEIYRIVNIFEILRENLLFDIDLSFITRLGKNLNAVRKLEGETYIHLPLFFKNLKEIHDLYFPEENIEQLNINENENNIDSQILQHESLIMQNQSYKNAIDEETQDEIYKADFNIKALYEKKNKSQMTQQFQQQQIEQIHPQEREDLVIQKEDDKEKEIQSLSPSKDNDDNLFFMTGAKIISNKSQEIENQNQQQHIENENENQIQEQQEEQLNEEHNEYDPEYPDNWADGAFELVINHCYECHTHSTTTRHYEYTFVDKFNKMGNEIKSVFPNVNLIGNYDDLDYFGQFDIYLHGLGPVFDEKSRFFLFKKNKSGRFPNPTEIIDKLVALAMIYGSSLNMESAQMQFLNEQTIGKRSKFCHEFPCELSEKAEEAKKESMKPKPQRIKKP